MMAKLKNALINLMIVLLSLLILTAVLEGFSRIFFSTVTKHETVIRNQHYGWEKAPNLDYVVHNWNGEFKFNTNSKGLRGLKDFPYEKTEGTYRILVLGDSFMEAGEVPLEQSFCYQLEKRLTEMLGPHIEVINAGVAGFGTDNEYLFYKHEGYKYAPDLVLLSFLTANDIMDNSYELTKNFFGSHEKPYFKIDNNNELKLNNFPYVPLAEKERATFQIKSFIRNNFTLYKVVGDKIKENPEVFSLLMKIGLIKEQQVYSNSDAIPVPYMIYSKSYSDEWKTAWTVTRKLILVLKKTVEENGSKFMMIGLTNPEQVHEFHWENITKKYTHMKPSEFDLDGPSRLLASFAKENSINFYNLLPHFQAKARLEKVLLHSIPEDAHWNPKGHWLAAELTSDYLSNLLASQNSRPEK